MSEDELLGTDISDSEFDSATTPEGYWCLFGLCWPWYVWVLSFAALIVLLIIILKPRKK